MLQNKNNSGSGFWRRELSFQNKARSGSERQHFSLSGPPEIIIDYPCSVFVSGSGFGEENSLVLLFFLTSVDRFGLRTLPAYKVHGEWRHS